MEIVAIDLDGAARRVGGLALPGKEQEQRKTRCEEVNEGIARPRGKCHEALLAREAGRIQTGEL